MKEKSDLIFPDLVMFLWKHCWSVKEKVKVNAEQMKAKIDDTQTPKIHEGFENPINIFHKDENEFELQ